jgi:hypothetical protein
MADHILHEKDTLLIHADTDIQIKQAAMSGLQEYLRKKNIKFFGFSPTMTAGCDISDIGLVDVMVMFVASGSVAWQDTWQMLRRVCEPECIIILFDKSIPKDSSTVWRRISEAQTGYNLRAMEREHYALKKLGMTNYMAIQTKSTNLLRRYTRSNKSAIFDVLTSVMNDRDNTRADIRNRLEGMVERTHGVYSKELPRHDAVAAHVEKASNKGSDDARDRESMALASIGPAVGRVDDEEGKRLDNLAKQKSGLTTQAEKMLLKRWRLERLYGDFAQHTSGWYKAFTDEDRIRQFVRLRYLLKHVNKIQYHVGDRIGMVIEQMAKERKATLTHAQGDYFATMKAGIRLREGEQSNRRVPIVAILEQLHSFMRRIGFKDSLLQKGAVAEEKCVHDEDAKAFMIDFGKWCVAHKDTQDYKRCGITHI